MPKIYIPQGCTGRICRETPPEFDSLCSTEFDTCVAVVLIGRGESKGKISLTHLDSSTNPSVLRKEMEWMKGQCIIRLGVKGERSRVLSPLPLEDSSDRETRRGENITEVFNILKQDVFPEGVEISSFAMQNGCLIVNKEGEVFDNIAFSKDLPGIEHPPREELRTYINYANQYLLRRHTNESDLQFNESEWTELPILHPEIACMFNTIRKGLERFDTLSKETRDVKIAALLIPVLITKANDRGENSELSKACTVRNYGFIRQVVTLTSQYLLLSESERELKEEDPSILDGSSAAAAAAVPPREKKPPSVELADAAPSAVAATAPSRKGGFGSNLAAVMRRRGGLF